MEEIKIEKNVPFVRTNLSERYPFSKMAVGDSFLFQCKDGFVERGRRNILMAANHYKKKHNKPDLKFRTAIENGNVRIWRLN